MIRPTVLAAILLFAGCSDAENAKRVLEQQGYTNVQITGARAWGCSDDDIYRTGFRATSPAGIVLTGVVCRNAMKASTIRFD